MATVAVGPAGVASAEAVAFPLLEDVKAYVPGTFDYTINNSRDAQHPVGLPEWLEVFRKSIPSFQRHARACEDVPEQLREQRAQEFACAFGRILDALLEDHTAGVPGHPGPGPVSCISLCRARDWCLHQAGFLDAFRGVKAKESTAALEMLPGVLQELDSITDDRRRLEAAVRGVLAGNLFDLGAAASAQAYESGDLSFAGTREKLLPRPWVVDDLDALLQRCSSGVPHRKAILFCDNAGADVILGMLPLARELLRRGTAVVLAANTRPSINDITAAELLPLVAAAAGRDGRLAEELAARRLRVVGSGNDLGVIDLRRVSPELAAEAEGSDLVVLEGMGRGIETNLRARFRADVVCVGMVKHPEVAYCLGGRMYDCVVRYTPAGR